MVVFTCPARIVFASISALPRAMLSEELSPLPVPRKNRLFDSYELPRNGSFTLRPNGLEPHDVNTPIVNRKNAIFFIFRILLLETTHFKSNENKVKIVPKAFY